MKFLKAHKNLIIIVMVLVLMASAAIWYLNRPTVKKSACIEGEELTAACAKETGSFGI